MAAAAAGSGAPVSADVAVHGRGLGGFDFSLKFRNEGLLKTGARPPRAMKTGTTICGVVFGDGVVLGADTRATEDSTVADKNCEKIHHIASNIYCCGAGTAADTENITQLISSNMELLRLQTKRQPRVVAACSMLRHRLFKYQGHISAALVLGGVDPTGPHLYSIYPHGSTDKLPFVTMGSGSLAAMSVMETGYKDDMTEEEAVALVSRAIRAGIFNDLGSGSNVDICIIRGDGVAEVRRNYQRPTELPEGAEDFEVSPALTIPPGATDVVREMFHKHVVVESVRELDGGEEEGKEAEGAAAAAMDEGE